MKFLQYCVAVMLVITLVNQSARAGCGASKPAGCSESSCGSCEPGFLCCQNKIKTVKVKKHCYEVECDHVCIPPVCLPKCPLFGAGDDCCNDGTNGCGGDCGAQGCQDCSQCKQEKGFFGRLCSKLTDCRIRKVHTLNKNEYEVEKCVCDWSVVFMQPPGCGKSCGEECCAPASCCAPCGE